MAIRRFLATHDDKAITAALDEVYAGVGAPLDPGLTRTQLLSLPSKEWA